ncbi:MAG: hypothetical protein E7398_00065 [Ruminococcaceae bacterium]|nr:hypothetical protein [Oscillospiraceae bacterium]
MNDKTCLQCEWLEKHKGQYICGCIAELYLIAARVEPKEKCRFDFAAKKMKRKETTHETNNF